MLENNFFHCVYVEVIHLMAFMCSFELGVDVMDYMDDLLGLQSAGK